MIICGIDEAGRGSVIGPLVVLGIAIHEKDIPSLKDVGVRDSKTLSRKVREELYQKILSLNVSVYEVVVDAAEVDRYLKKRSGPSINTLEANAAAEIIRNLRPDVVYIDSPDVKPTRHAERVLAMLDYSPRIVCEHKADSRYEVVAAASVLAKVRRDTMLAKLSEVYGDLGSGYPSDKRTIDFLSKCLRDEDEIPSCVRKGWRTIDKLLQAKLDLFGER
ncbi:MAG: ribonuclease HII [Nitrososphaerota archaeon]|nr:ribonuclease HII [Aigarchaeota archaeon]MDW8076893.1 ribonuclease HII [Nitrososphaerota archaeon]